MSTFGTPEGHFVVAISVLAMRTMSDGFILARSYIYAKTKAFLILVNLSRISLDSLLHDLGHVAPLKEIF